MRSLIAFARQACTCVLLSATAAMAAMAAPYPDHPVRLVVPFPAGSSTDAIGRVVAQALSKGFDQAFVVDNRPGALATIGAAEVARSKPDGYTLVLGTSTSHAAASSLFKTLPYDPDKSFVAIGRVAAVAFVVVVRPDLPVRSVADLIALGKQTGGKPLSWGYANSANEVAGAALVNHGGFEATEVSYKGVPQILVDMLGGNLDFTVADTTSVLPQIKAGRLRALAVTSENELADLPGVPPLSNTIPGFRLLGWYGVFAPAGTPAPIVDDLSRKLQAALNAPSVQQEIAQVGLMTLPASGPETRAFVISETAKWAELVKAAHIQPQ